MEEIIGKIKLRCVFCRSNDFALPWEGYIPFAGSFVVCANCGNENDLTSLRETARNSGEVLVKAYADELIKNMGKNLKK